MRLIGAGGNEAVAEIGIAVAVLALDVVGVKGRVAAVEGTEGAGDLVIVAGVRPGFVDLKLEAVLEAAVQLGRQRVVPEVGERSRC